MQNFFLNQNGDLKIRIFSIYHLLLILIVFLIVLVIIGYREKIYNLSENRKKIIRYIFAGILFINFLLRRGSFIYYGVYSTKIHLDINFCNFTSILFFTYAVSGNRKIYNICYYMAFIGPLLSIIFPSVNISPLNYSFYSFLIIHHLVFIFNFIFLFFESVECTKEKLINIIKFLIVYFSFIMIFNFIFNTNYNLPNNFINIDFINKNHIKNILTNKMLSYSIMYLVILTFILISHKVLEFFNLIQMSNKNKLIKK